MDRRPSDQELAAAVGAAGKQAKRVRGGPYLYQFEVDGRAREVLVLDGKVAPKGLASVGRYLRAVGMLSQKQMTFQQLLGLLANYGELPTGFDSFDALYCRGLRDEAPSLHYDDDGGATLIVFADDPLPASKPPPPGAPTPTTPTVGPSPPRLLRATMRVSHDYQLSWTVERLVEASTNRWSPR